VIVAADDVGDPQLGVIDNACERVQERAVRADDDGIRQRADVDCLVAANEVVPRDDGGERRKAVLGIGQPEAPVRTPPLASSLARSAASSFSPARS
jgi:hypothetical protein